MRVSVLAGLLLALFAPASPVAANPQPEAAKVDPSAKEAGLRFARTVYSEETQLTIAERMVDTELGPVFRSNEDFKILEAEYPGFTDAVLKEFKVALVRFTRAALPDYHERIAMLMASRLSAEEIADLTQFYLTPTGQKLLRGIKENATVGATLAEVAGDPDKPTSLSAITADHRATAAGAVKSIDESDAPALIALTRKPYFARAKTLIPELRKLDQDLMNEPAPEFEKEIQTIIKNTLARFEAAKTKK